MSKQQGIMEYTINDVAITWDELERRVERPCFGCEKPTKGRMNTVQAKKIPYHLSCAVEYATKKALKSITTVVRHG